ncbi:MAG: hypothetical protein Q9215_002424 [Flavoplaca cf. flavocitrina]
MSGEAAPLLLGGFGALYEEFTARKAAGAETTSRREGDCALREVNRSNLVDVRGLVGAERLAADEVIEE